PSAQSKLTRRILLGLAAGLFAGLAIHWISPPGGGAPDAADGVLQRVLTQGVLHVVGELFLRGLSLLVVPLVLVSLVCGTASLDDVRRLGRMGAKTLVLYLLTTALAVALALVLAVLVRPGAGFDLAAGGGYTAREAPSLMDTLIGMVPRNPVAALAEGNMLQIIVFAVLLGLALALSGDAGRRVLRVFEDLNTVVMRLVWMVMAAAPFGVFALIARTFAAQGMDAVPRLLLYFLVVLAALVTHTLVVYPLLLRLVGRLRPLPFFRKMWQTQVFAFSTASSNATLPVTLDAVENRLGVKPAVAAFTVPLGATINMDGTAIMQGVATAFVAQAYGVALSPAAYAMIVVTATLASIGTAGVPGVGLVMLAMVFGQVGLPVEGIGLILGVDRLLDMLRTAVNVTGDAVVSCVVAHSEGELDRATYDG
nr:dicarboxylate/amino acid:cation symporter [Akkermansiaceae bacterium]